MASGSQRCETVAERVVGTRWKDSAATVATMTVDEAALFVVLYARPESPRSETLAVAEELAERAGLPDERRRMLVRSAVKRLHPDRHGDPEMFRQLLEARGVLDHARRA